MAATRFTDSYIRQLKPGKTSRKKRDVTDFKGFGIQVNPGGTKTFFFACTVAKREMFIDLGRYIPPLGGGIPSNLKERREYARTLRALVDQGIDPETWIKEQHAQLEAQRHGTVVDVLNNYLDYLRSAGKRSAKQAGQIFKQVLEYIDPDIPAKDLSTEMLFHALQSFHERGAHTQGNRAYAYLRAAFEYALKSPYDPSRKAAAKRFYLTSNPVTPLKSSSFTESVGDRHLTFDEIKQLWRSLSSYQGMSIDAIAAILLLLITGQRVEMVLGALVEEFDLEAALWTIPASRMKMGIEHAVPLHSSAIEIIQAQMRLHSDSPLLFPGVRDRLIGMNANSLSRAVSRYCERTGFDKFTPRDLRRTWKTRAGDLRIAKEDRDRIQAHALRGDVSSKHYDRGEYLEQKTTALNHTRNGRT